MALLGAGVLVAMVGLGVLTVLGTARTQQRDQAAEQRTDAAQEARRVGAPALALCSTGGDVVPILEAAGLCDAASRALGNPVVAANTPPLTPQEIDTIVSRVLPATLPGAALVPGVLDRLSVDPQGAGLDEAATRAIVAAAVGRADQQQGQSTAAPSVPEDEQPDGGQPQPSPDPDPDPPAEQMTGLRFERDADGTCRGITTFTREDGSTREEVSAAPDGACDPPTDPPPQTGEPPVTSAPETPQETPEPSPTDEPGVTLLPPS